MGRTKALGQKHDLDKIYTTDENAQWAVNKLNLNNYSNVIEPSAGGGSFNRAILKVKPNILLESYDIHPEYSGVIKEDFLNHSINKNYENVLVIGNPPYGQQNTLALKFINHSANFNNVLTIAFILPKSFRKDSLQNKVNLNFHLIADYDLPNNNFTLEGANYKVNTCFQIWERKETPRLKKTFKNTTNLLSFVGAVEDADLRIQRVGGRSGKAFKDLTLSPSSNYLIKLDGVIPKNYINTFIERVNKLVFPTVEFTVGPKSISKSELIEVLEEEFKDFLL